MIKTENLTEDERELYMPLWEKILRNALPAIIFIGAIIITGLVDHPHYL